MFLLKYSGLHIGDNNYILVYAATEEEAIEKLKKEKFYIDQLHVTSATLK